MSKRSTDSLTDEQHTALKELARDKTIVVTKADKGNAVVIQNVDDYRKKVLNILDDKSKFQVLDDGRSTSLCFPSILRNCGYAAIINVLIS
jgi:hypothetical protein